MPHPPNALYLHKQTVLAAYPHAHLSIQSSILVSVKLQTYLHCHTPAVKQIALAVFLSYTEHQFQEGLPQDSQTFLGKFPWKLWTGQCGSACQGLVGSHTGSAHYTGSAT